MNCCIWILIDDVFVFVLLDVSILHTSTVFTSFNRSISEQLFITRYWLDTWITWSHWGKVDVSVGHCLHFWYILCDTCAHATCSSFFNLQNVWCILILL